MCVCVRVLVSNWKLLLCEGLSSIHENKSGRYTNKCRPQSGKISQCTVPMYSSFNLEADTCWLSRIKARYHLPL